MKIDISEGNRIFSIIADYSLIMKELAELQNDFESARYSHYGESFEFNDPYLTEEEVKRNATDFCSEVKSALEEAKLKAIISSWPRKKNGTFNRRNVKEIATCGNCIAIHEWHNTWIYQVLKVSARDDTTLVVTLHEKVDTPC